MSVGLWNGCLGIHIIVVLFPASGTLHHCRGSPSMCIDWPRGVTLLGASPNLEHHKRQMSPHRLDNFI